MGLLERVSPPDTAQAVRAETGGGEVAKKQNLVSSRLWLCMAREGRLPRSRWAPQLLAGLGRAMGSHGLGCRKLVKKVEGDLASGLSLAYL